MQSFGTDSVDREYVRRVCSEIEDSMDRVLRYTSKRYEDMSEAERALFATTSSS